jgi:two-component system phosphate regulon sensor histidine kinase PhoR
VVERLAPLAKKNQVKLTAGDLPELPVLGDQQFLVQMMSNLVDNAIKYTSGEDKCVEVMAGASNSGHSMQAWARVIDNGPGISAEHLPHLFDRFYQADRARTKQDQELESQGGQTPTGTGLGLSIVSRIIEMHKGRIWISSRGIPGEGSVFSFTLPIYKREAELEPQ